MMLPVLFAAVSGVFEDQYSAPIDVPQPIRLELTPVIDGSLANEEWDPFSQGTYLQWEPGKIYAAAQAGGKDLVLSVDGKADGWLIGRDNIEFRVTVRDGKAVIRARELDATQVREPVWRDRPDLEAGSYAAIGANGEIEAAFADPSGTVFPKTRKNITMRLDLTGPLEDSPAYLPRNCRSIRLDDTRSVALPSTMDFGIQSRSRSVIPGENIWMRLNFKGNAKVGAKSIDLRGAGDAEAVSNRMSVVFPTFDNKGRAFVDYSSKIETSATPGYKIMRGTLNFTDGPAAMVEASYRVAPLMDFSLMRSTFDRLPENNTLRIPYTLQLYTRQPAEGIVKIAPPPGWEVVKGNGKGFSVLGNQSADTGTFELRAPADAHGTFAVKISGETKAQTVDQICYVTIR